MALRRPPSDIDPVQEWMQASAKEDECVEWTAYECKLLTPLFGGGVVSRNVDYALPVRAAAIRGQLRYWWRLLKRQRADSMTAQELRRAEFEIWGGTTSALPIASRVFLQICSLAGKEDTEPVQEKIEGNKDKYEFTEKYAPWKYALFPAQAQTDGTPPAELMPPGMAWTLKVGLSNTLTQDQKHEVAETLRWWACFGGLGSRTRRGLGHVYIAALQPVSESEVTSMGMTLSLRKKKHDSASDAALESLEVMRNFRQGDLGRVNGNATVPGASRWPEARSYRNIFGTHYKHDPSGLAPAQSFPRAAFGLPLITKFKDRGDPGNNGGQGSQINLLPRGKERMASPVVLKPYPVEGRWVAACLVLPHEGVWGLDLEITMDGNNAGDIAAGEWWKSEHYKDIDALKGISGAKDPIGAFVGYFRSARM